MAMNLSETFQVLLSKTEIQKDRGFICGAGELSARENYLFDLAKLKIGADALFVQYSPFGGGCVPVAYFRRLEDPDPSAIADVHKLAWNMGQAPLLFVILPGEVRIFSTYKNPKRKRTGELKNGGTSYRACLTL